MLALGQKPLTPLHALTGGYSMHVVMFLSHHGFPPIYGFPQLQLVPNLHSRVSGILS